MGKGRLRQTFMKAPMFHVSASCGRANNAIPLTRQLPKACICQLRSQVSTFWTSLPAQIWSWKVLGKSWMKKWN